MSLRHVGRTRNLSRDDSLRAILETCLSSLSARAPGCPVHADPLRSRWGPPRSPSQLQPRPGLQVRASDAPWDPLADSHRCLRLTHLREDWRQRQPHVRVREPRFGLGRAGSQRGGGAGVEQTPPPRRQSEPGPRAHGPTRVGGPLITRTRWGLGRTLLRGSCEFRVKRFHLLS